MDRKALAAAVVVARRQYGFITSTQALQAGLSPAVIARLVAEGHWRQVGGGLYQLNGVAPSWRGRLMSACLRGGEGAENPPFR